MSKILSEFLISAWPRDVFTLGYCYLKVMLLFTGGPIALPLESSMKEVLGVIVPAQWH